MPRFVDRRRSLSPEERRDRARTIRVGVGSGEFHDPYGNVPGTLPEKVVFNELVERGIPFRFQDYLHVYVRYFINKWYRPDFILPYEKVIIEVQGSYWHSRDKTIEKDAYKIALYRLIGWRVLTWWDYEILEGVDNLFVRDLYRLRKKVAPGLSAHLPRKHAIRKRKDDSSGIKTLNRKRGKKWKQQATTRKYRSRRKYRVQRSYPVHSD